MDIKNKAVELENYKLYIHSYNLSLINTVVVKINQKGSKNKL